MGSNKRPFFRVVVADQRSPRDGRFIENIGRYHPLNDPSVIDIDQERALHWLRVGAQPSNQVRTLMQKVGIWEEFVRERPGAATAAAKERVPKEKVSKKAKQRAETETAQAAAPTEATDTEQTEPGLERPDAASAEGDAADASAAEASDAEASDAEADAAESLEATDEVPPAEDTEAE
jgi:small subunit ribosomal protein S16